MNVSDSYPAPQLKEFIIEKRLGAGSYASVYQARNKNTNELSAIKCIKKSGLNKASTENLFCEIKILKQIKHDYIVQLKEFQWDDNYIYLIMEYCQGGDLSNFIRSRRTIPEKYVRKFIQQIACALKHLHSIGIAHMDLKPQNILLTSVNNPSLKLADFGFAQYMQEHKISKSLRGSPLYMAPEILKSKVYDSKVDLWSVGVILYEVIFGYAPFVSNSLEELEKKILDDTPIQIPTHIMLSETCKDLLRGLLQRNPSNRISFETFFNHPFVDLEHLPNEQSLSKANQLLEKAIRADQRKDNITAQRYYLQSIEYLIPAIQFEKDPKRKQEIREKARSYIQRAEEIASISKKESKPIYSRESSASLKRTESFEHSSKRVDTFDNLAISPLTTSINSSIVQLASSVDSQTQILLNLFKNNEQILTPFKMCLEADKTITSSNLALNYADLFMKYQTGISVLLPMAKTFPKESDASKLLKIYIEKWLSTAEILKTKLSDQQNNQIMQVNEDFKEEDDNVTYYKQCSIQ